MALRTSVTNAIFNLLQNVIFPQQIMGQTTWVTKELKLRLWGDVPPDQQPYMCLVSHRELDEYRNLGVERRRLEYLVFCYSRTDNSNGIIDLDNMLTGIETAFENNVDNFTTNSVTFNGLVYWCRIEGRIFKDPGDLDSQAMLIVTITVEMP